MKRFGIIFFWCLYFSGTAYAVEELPASREEVQLSYAKLVKKVGPAVVNIFASRQVQSTGESPLMQDPFFRDFFGEDFFSSNSPTQIQRSLGSGVIVRSDGIIVTNYHVIRHAEDIRVVLSDGREMDAVVLVKDPRTDLAVLKLDGNHKDLPFMSLKDVDEIQVGDLVLAIGNPFGLGQTVTTGIVSALAQTQIGVSDFRSFIQTDAAINPGNSGGALVAMDGKLAGINTAILSKSGGSVGIGFAIPSNLIIPLLESLKYNGKIVRPWMGLNVKTAELAEVNTYGLESPKGVIVMNVYPDSPAAKAGLKKNDLILAYDGKELRNEAAFLFRIASQKVTDKVELTVLEVGGQKKTLAVQLEAPTGEDDIKPVVLTGRHPLEGASVANLTPALASDLGEDYMDLGVVILSVATGRAAKKVGLLPGDIIQSLNDQPIKSVEGLVDRLSKSRGGIVGKERVSWKIEIKRAGKKYTIVLQ
ncbi:MAG: Do family serine endopeptidase [Alphaproteobacteria bacterium]|nr:Do family serine endopeptidase [Alphaproteobacteria bacterium]